VTERAIDSNDLRVGDRIRIIGIPGEGVPGYFLHADTKRAFMKLIARGRSVRICRIDEFGHPWYDFRFRMKNGRWERHSLNITSDEHNWVRV
jgi:hypothetical protein